MAKNKSKSGKKSKGMSLVEANYRAEGKAVPMPSLVELDKYLKSIGKEKGGEAVPKKFKGFSKLPEKVQEKIDPKLAQEYEYGGSVMKMKDGGSTCRGMGAAMRGGKYTGCK